VKPDRRPVATESGPLLTLAPLLAILAAVLLAFLAGRSGSITATLVLGVVAAAGAMAAWLVFARAWRRSAADAVAHAASSYARFRTIVQIASDAIISVDREQRIVHFNKGAEDIFGWSAEEICGQPLQKLLPERYRGGHGDHLRRFAAAPQTARRMGERQEIAGLRRDGTEFPAEASISKVELEDGMLFTVLLRDISLRRRAEEGQRILAHAGARLAASLDPETTLQTITQVMIPELADWCTIYVVDEHGGVRRLEIAHADPVREAMLRGLLRTPLDPSGPNPVLRVIASAASELIREVPPQLLEDSVPEEAYLRMLTAAGIHSAVIVPLVARGRTLGAIGMYSSGDRRFDEDDMVLVEELGRRAALALDNARLYEESRQALAARDDVLAIVSHDLGQPLTAIRIGTSLLLRRVPAEERGSGAWAHLEGIRQSAEQMERLINDLLEAKRLEAGEVRLDRECLDPGALLREAAELARPLAEEHGIGLSVEPVVTDRTAWADRDRILQVLSNLLGNAIKFTPEGGAIALRGHVEGKELRLAVADTGRGISDEERPFLFERYWQAGRSRRGSAGLGLSIVKGIVESHGGSVWVESQLGAGSTFTFTLPTAPPPDATQPPGSSAPS